MKPYLALKRHTGSVTTPSPRNGSNAPTCSCRCVSATHVAYGSIRMEADFMVLGHSAGVAAVLALEGGTSVQQVPYEKFKINLERDGQVLAIPASSSRSKKK